MTARALHLQDLKGCIIKVHPQIDDVAQDIQKYWPIRYEWAMTNGMTIKGRLVIIPSQVHNQILKQLHNNHMGIKKMRLPVCESVYWVNRNDDIENVVEQHYTCLEYQSMQPQEKTIH